MLERRDERPPHVFRMQVCSTQHLDLDYVAPKQCYGDHWKVAAGRRLSCFFILRVERWSKRDSFWRLPINIKISIICLISPQHFYSKRATLISGCSGNVSASQDSWAFSANSQFDSRPRGCYRCYWDRIEEFRSVSTDVWCLNQYNAGNPDASNVLHKRQTHRKTLKCFTTWKSKSSHFW